MDLYVNFRNDGDSYHDGKQYGAWSKSNRYKFHDIRNNREDCFDYEMLTVNFIPESDDTLYYVWVDYNTGDSFGEETNRMCEIGIYKTYKDAKDISDKIYAYQSGVRAESLISDLEGFNIYAGTWNGYFESFNSVEIETLTYVEKE